MNQSKRAERSSAVADEALSGSMSANITKVRAANKKSSESGSLEDSTRGTTANYFNVGPPMNHG